MSGGRSLTQAQIEAFIERGYVHLPQAVARATVDTGSRALWQQMGLSAAQPAQWPEPVVRLLPDDDTAFAEAFRSPDITQALDQLVGAGRWLPRPNLGWFVVRFPHPSAPADTGWHVEGSFQLEGETEHRTNVASRGRALLMLFLYSEVGEDDGPTRIRTGSHRDVAHVLAAYGDDGLRFSELAPLATAASEGCDEVTATGSAGDVYLCHPFLVHAAQAHRGATPRLMAQPPLQPSADWQPLRDEIPACPVEEAIRRAVAGPR